MPLVDVVLHPYQQAAVDAMLAVDRGLVVMPCGSGKTVVMASAAVARGGHALLVCPTHDVATQTGAWLLEHTAGVRVEVCTTSVPPGMPMRRLLSDPSALLVVTTYSMLSEARAEGARLRVGAIERHAWCTVLLDEVHCAAAERYAEAWRLLTRGALFGLTATLVRADDGVARLLADVGAVIAEVGVHELVGLRVLAPVELTLVVCPPTQAAGADELKVLNASKLAVCDALVRRHRGEQKLIFCDTIWACLLLARRYACPAICGDTPASERDFMLQRFRANAFDLLVVSRVGDAGLDFVDVSVGIALDSHFGSSRQQAQRVGRLMRMPPRAATKRSAFYDVVLEADEPLAHFDRRCAYMEQLELTFTRQRASDVDEAAALEAPLMDDHILAAARAFREHAPAPRARKRAPSVQQRLLKRMRSHR